MNVSSEMLGGAILLVAGYALFSASKVFRYYTKWVFFCIGACIAASIFIPVMLLRPRDYRNGLLPSWGARQISKCLGLKWSVRGTENIVQDTGCVILINHQSAVDLIVLANIWPIMGRCTVISKREIFYLWPFGLAAWLWGTIFIDRLNVEKAQSTINKTGDTIRNNKAKLAMFPEGTRHIGDELLPFKKGAFHVAIASQTPIQPIVVSRYYFLDSKTYKFDAGKSVIEILPAIPTAGLTKNDIGELIEKTRTVMNNAYKKLTQQVTSNCDSSINNIDTSDSTKS
ncbi:unnamed protein product [Bemisia tabaci]|uniref:1-acyl-sn-glycerol-3-phosphate acyltransferase n=1 Tax=Bemisia tabaci TaxID=7038 RepID=A0A9P0A919_BEMTA|nr:PREDICTED: 1-acyl-sn-glycerol-3-phosphate acyltransferase beta-like [Bemisia tabaci]CAH0389204.1 unnamed protein product [Bemisia tabaci]